MRGCLKRRLVVLSACALTTVLGLAGAADASPPPPGSVSFSTPTQFPKFRPGIYDYVVRCNDGPVTVSGHAAGGWRLAVGNQTFHGGDFSQNVALRAGKAFTAIAKSGPSLYRYHVRCLPDGFPDYTFTHDGPASPKLFSVDEAFVPAPSKRYSMVFNRHGVPVWWRRAPAWDSRVLPNGSLLWWNASALVFQTHDLEGGLLVNGMNTVGQQANPHDIQFTGGGDYLAGAYVTQGGVDTSAYGGASDASVSNAELQEVSSDGQLLWDWKSQDHISLSETGHRWPWVIHHSGLGGYDVVHWNSIEDDGNSVIASFRNLDAVYKINKQTGDIVWKLGGTHTPQSLDVKGDPRGATLGAQHDARLLPDGTLTVFDNRTNLQDHQPRAERFRINESTGTATLIESIADPEISGSNCCGSARRLGSGDWLIDWGQNRPIGGYRPSGKRTFLLTLDSTFSYRAEPVPSGAVSIQDLRQAMDAISAQSHSS
ncbi:MAG: arylsulfotransferase family protein [Solirubrobacterales bacterium]